MPNRQEHAGRTAMLLLAVVLAIAGCGGDDDGGGRAEPEASSEEHTTGPAPVTGPTLLECGQPFQLPAGGELALTGQFPATASTGQQAVTGTVEATSRQAVRGVVAPRADVFLVRDGRVATMPMAQNAMGIRWDLAPGKVERLPGEARLVSCDPAGGPVRPGTYELYVRVMFIPDDGASVESFGGPWPLEVR